METPDLLSLGYSVSPLHLCSPVPGCWHPSTFWACYAIEWVLVEAHTLPEKWGIWTVVGFWVDIKQNVGEKAKGL